MRRLFKRFHNGAGVALPLIAAAALVLTLGASANASPIVLVGLGSSSQNVTIKNAGSGALIDVTFGSGTLSGNALNDVSPQAGSYTMSFAPAGPYTADTASPISPGGSMYALNAPGGEVATFSYSDAGGNTLGGALTVNSISDGSPQPRFNGFFQATTATGVFASFLNDYLGIDFTLNKMTCSSLTPESNCTIEKIGTTSGETATATVSSGEVTSPEPGSLALIALGLALVGTAVIKRSAAPDLAA